jgi:hypothetical protein
MYLIIPAAANELPALQQLEQKFIADGHLLNFRLVGPILHRRVLVRATDLRNCAETTGINNARVEQKQGAARRDYGCEAPGEEAPATEFRGFAALADNCANLLNG